jgi:acyl carrier protein
MKLQNIIETKFRTALESSDCKAPEFLNDDLVLLESGLDSLGFAILITTLEDELGYDPFTLMKDAFYPRTYGEFVAIYLSYVSHAKDGITP